MNKFIALFGVSLTIFIIGSPVYSAPDCLLAPQGCTASGTPGPIAGVGIPFLIAGIVAYRRKRKTHSAQESE